MVNANKFIFFLTFVISIIFSSIGIASNPLIEAIENEDEVKTFNLIKSKPELINKTDTKGYDAVYHAVSLANYKVVKKLIENKADLNKMYNTKKESLLFEATRLGDLKIIELIISKNEKILKQKSIDQDSVLHEAVRAEQAEVAEYYIKKNLDKYEKNIQGKTAVDLVSPVNLKMKKVFNIK